MPLMKPPSWLHTLLDLLGAALAVAILIVVLILL